MLMKLLTDEFIKILMSVMKVMTVTMSALIRMGLIHAHVMLAMNCSLITGLVKVILSG